MVEATPNRDEENSLKKLNKELIKKVAKLEKKLKKLTKGISCHGNIILNIIRY